MTAATLANPRVVIGNNSRSAELAALAQVMRVELQGYEMTPLWQARWEIALNQELGAADKLLSLLMSFFEEFRGRANPGIKVLEMMTGLADRRVRLGLKLNEKQGFLVKQGGGHRTQSSVYTVQIPEKTLLELSERRHPSAANPEKGGIGGTPIPAMPPFKGGTGGTPVPPIPPAYKDTKNNNNNDSAEPSDQVHVNGTSISGPGFKMTYTEIENTAFLAGSKLDRGKAMAIILANQWTADGITPERPMIWLAKALRADQLRQETHSHKLKKAVAEIDAAPPQIARGSPPESRPQWSINRDAKQEAERQNKVRYEQGMIEAQKRIAKQQEQGK